MNVTTEKMVCTSCSEVDNGVLTVGRIYVVSTEKSPFDNFDFTFKSFVGDDGREYLIQHGDNNFKCVSRYAFKIISLEEWRQRQLDNILES